MGGISVSTTDLLTSTSLYSSKFLTSHLYKGFISLLGLIESAESSLHISQSTGTSASPFNMVE